MDNGELVDLGGLEIPGARLEPDVAAPDPELMRALDEVVAHAPERFEPEGWRVVAGADDHVTVATFALDWDGWVVTTLRREAGRWRWSGPISYGVQPRPPASVRGRGFTLELVDDSLHASTGTAPRVRARLINRSAPRWAHAGAGYATGSLYDTHSGERLGTGRWARLSPRFSVPAPPAS